MNCHFCLARIAKAPGACGYCNPPSTPMCLPRPRSGVCVEGGHISSPPSTQAGLPGASMACRARRWIAEMSLPCPWSFAVPSHPAPVRLMSAGLETDVLNGIALDTGHRQDLPPANTGRDSTKSVC